jgi:hypothetical protein
MPGLTFGAMIPLSDMCQECRSASIEGKANVTPRREREKLPDPNDGDLCRRCGVRLRFVP